jgi:predicted GIY-YIG superfamily endonuclease
MMINRVYIIINGTGLRYIGLSEDVDLRLHQHNTGVSTWTRGKGSWSFPWVSGALELSTARKLENELKRHKGGQGLTAYLAAIPSSGSKSRRAGSQIQTLAP